MRSRHQPRRSRSGPHSVPDPSPEATAPAALPVLAPAAAAAIADVMFAASTPTRVSILRLLAAEPAPVGDLVSALEMEQSAVSHQLRVLREHRLVASERRGRERVYRLASPSVGALLGLAAELAEVPLADAVRDEVVDTDADESADRPALRRIG